MAFATVSPISRVPVETVAWPGPVSIGGGSECEPQFDTLNRGEIAFVRQHHDLADQRHRPQVNQCRRISAELAPRPVSRFLRDAAPKVVPELRQHGMICSYAIRTRIDMVTIVSVFESESGAEDAWMAISGHLHEVTGRQPRVRRADSWPGGRSPHVGHGWIPLEQVILVSDGEGSRREISLPLRLSSTRCGHR